MPRPGTEAACGADAGAAAGEPDRLASDDGRSGDDGGVEAVSTCYAKEARRGLLTPSGPSAGRDLERLQTPRSPRLFHAMKHSADSALANRGALPESWFFWRRWRHPKPA